MAALPSWLTAAEAQEEGVFGVDQMPPEASALLPVLNPLNMTTEYQAFDWLFDPNNIEDAANILNIENEKAQRLTMAEATPIEVFDPESSADEVNSFQTLWTDTLESRHIENPNLPLRDWSTLGKDSSSLDWQSSSLPSSNPPSFYSSASCSNSTISTENCSNSIKTMGDAFSIPTPIINKVSDGESATQQHIAALEMQSTTQQQYQHQHQHQQQRQPPTPLTPHLLQNAHLSRPPAAQNFGMYPSQNIQNSLGFSSGQISMPSTTSTTTTSNITMGSLETMLQGQQTQQVQRQQQQQQQQQPTTWRMQPRGQVQLNTHNTAALQQQSDLSFQIPQQGNEYPNMLTTTNFQQPQKQAFLQQQQQQGQSQTVKSLLNRCCPPTKNCIIDDLRETILCAYCKGQAYAHREMASRLGAEIQSQGTVFGQPSISALARSPFNLNDSVLKYMETNNQAGSQAAAVVADRFVNAVRQKYSGKLGVYGSNLYDSGFHGFSQIAQSGNICLTPSTSQTGSSNLMQYPANSTRLSKGPTTFSGHLPANQAKPDPNEGKFLLMDSLKLERCVDGKNTTAFYNCSDGRLRQLNAIELAAAQARTEAWGKVMKDKAAAIARQTQQTKIMKLPPKNERKQSGVAKEKGLIVRRQKRVLDEEASTPRRKRLKAKMEDAPPPAPASSEADATAAAAAGDGGGNSTLTTEFTKDEVDQAQIAP